MEKWAEKWSMRFNAKKCYIMSINRQFSHFYSLSNHMLKQVEENPYLGVTLTENLKWSFHATEITKMANSTAGLLRRNLKILSTRLSENCIFITCSFNVGLRLHSLGPLPYFRCWENWKSWRSQFVCTLSLDYQWMDSDQTWCIVRMGRKLNRFSRSLCDLVCKNEPSLHWIWKTDLWILTELA